MNEIEMKAIDQVLHEARIIAASDGNPKELSEDHVKTAIRNIALVQKLIHEHFVQNKRH